jgi:hypothetical protein
MAGCTLQPESEADMAKNVASANSDMFRTDAAGSSLTDLPEGRQVPSLAVRDLDPGEYTIQFEVYPPEDGKGFAAYAIVSWKIDGQQITRKLTVFSGASISGVAEAVDVRIVDVSDIGRTSAPPLTYKVEATLAKGVRPTTMQPPTLNTRSAVIFFNGPNSATYEIPKNAGVISALVLGSNVDNTVPPSTLELRASAVDAFSTTLQSWFPIQNLGFIPLPGNATEVFLEYNGTGQFVVNITWGIEG